MPATQGECGNQPADAQRMGGGGKRRGGNVLEPNNRHVDVFAGWPSSNDGYGTAQVPGCQGVMGAQTRDSQRHSAG